VRYDELQRETYMKISVFSSSPRYKVSRVTLAPYAVNNRGQVVGYGSYSAALWQNGETLLLDRLDGPARPLPKGLTGSPASAHAINDQGWIVGWSDSLSGPTEGQVRPFLWRNGKTSLIDVALFRARRRSGEANPSEAGRAVNNWGEVIVTNDDGTIVLWRAGRVQEVVPRWPDFTPGFAVPMIVPVLNNAGMVAGCSYLKEQRVWEAWLWKDGKRSPLTNISPATDLRVSDINDRGTVLGFRENRSFLWKAGRVIDLGPLDLKALNNHEQIVGSRVGPPQGSGALLWQSGRTHDLNDLVVTEQSKTPLLGAAVDINNHGQILCTDGGSGHLLTPY